MSEVNDAYLQMLKMLYTEIIETGNYHRHLRKLLSERLPDVHFVKSVRIKSLTNLFSQRQSARPWMALFVDGSERHSRPIETDDYHALRRADAELRLDVQRRL